jgi:NAD-dependent dihydropyrimidine dehydrogenase PreA subunit
MAKREGRVEVQSDRCKGCGICVENCPTHSLELGTGLNILGYHPVEYREDSGCTGCGVCFFSCPEPAALLVYLKKNDAA